MGLFRYYFTLLYYSSTFGSETTFQALRWGFCPASWPAQSNQRRLHTSRRLHWASGSLGRGCSGCPGCRDRWRNPAATQETGCRLNEGISPWIHTGERRFLVDKQNGEGIILAPMVSERAAQHHTKPAAVLKEVSLSWGSLLWIQDYHSSLRLPCKKAPPNPDWYWFVFFRKTKE